jgi:hypothetical protein
MSAVRFRLVAALAILCVGTSCRQEEMGVTQPHSSSARSQGDPPASPIALSCNFTAQLSALEFAGSVRNGSGHDIYLVNRLWTLDASGKVITDPEKFYRFVRGEELRILFGAAPLPRMHSVTYRNLPYATLVKAGAEFEFHESTPLPATEYSVYFAPPGERDTALVPVSRIVLVMQYAEAGRDVRAHPLTDDASAWRFESAAALDHVRTLQCSGAAEKMQARRRSDQFDRLTLPGEPPEPLVPHS